MNEKTINLLAQWIDSLTQKEDSAALCSDEKERLQIKAECVEQYSDLYTRLQDVVVKDCAFSYMVINETLRQRLNLN